ncbi:MAG TPA: hypothetical protein VM778_14695 [Gemmatimonadota bacterium]|nr:hypothetical protein [Gemmatimonadota bacterium]
MNRSPILLAALSLACSGGSPPVAPPDPGGDPPPAGGLAVVWEARTVEWGEGVTLRAELGGAAAPASTEWVSLGDLYMGEPVVLGRGAEITTSALRPGTTLVEARVGELRRTVEVEVRYRESWNLALEGRVPYADGTTGDVWVVDDVAVVARRGAGGASIVRLDGLITEIGRFTMPDLFTQDVKGADGIAYLSNEGNAAAQPFSVAILDISDPTAPALVGTVPRLHAPNAHNLWLEGSVLSIASPMGGDVVLVDVSDPAAPRRLNQVAAQDATAHCVHARDGLLFGSFLPLRAGEIGELTIADVSNPAAPAVLARIRYEHAFTHSAWLSADGRHLFVADEVVNSPIRIFDVSNPAAPFLAGTYQPRLGTIPHNFQVRDGRFAYLANYKNGVEVVDVSDPTRPRLVGFYDTHPGIANDVGAGFPVALAPAHEGHAKGAGPFQGAWGVHWTDDGRIVASDMNTGLYVFRYTGG